MAIIPITSLDPVVDNSVKPAKKGIASSKLFCCSSGRCVDRYGDARGRHLENHRVDYDVTNILFLYNEIKTIVWQ